MEKYDHLLACHIEVVKKEFEKSGLNYKLIESKPPGRKKKSGQGQPRVIALKKEDDLYKIIWCYEKYL